jgi:hypothetical protein
MRGLNVVKGDRPDRAAAHKKKTMKTKSNKNQIKDLELKSRPEQSTTATATATAPDRAGGRPARVLPFVDYQQRELNRQLPTDTVLAMLRQHLPDQYLFAEVVGKWIWIQFAGAPPQEIRAQLSQFGFHWNNVRKCWQHPCGQVTQRGQTEPHEKYASYFPADQVAA